MVVERPPKVNPPSGRVPGQVLQAIPRSESRRRWNSRYFRGTETSLRVFETGASEVATLAQAARGRGPPGRAVGLPGWGVGPLCLSFGLLESSVIKDF